eukprot:jgi/Orpsp1_1/1176556/evm.model.c7180000058071.1
MREFHKYPVIYLNFKSDESINYDEAIAFLKTQISEVFEYYKEKINFKELNINEQTEWNKIENKEVDKLYNSIIFLMKILKRFYKRRCIVLIDEYDKILINGIEFKYYDKINRDIKSFISNTFKGNPYIYFGVLTGCLDIGLKGVFSGANNFYKCSMLFDTCFSDCYGFTNAELNDIFKHFDVSEVDKKQIKKQYNGYSCGSDEGIIDNLYNPFSIMYFIRDNLKLNEKNIYRDHWANSGTDSILKEIIKTIKYNFVDDFFQLINDKTEYINQNIDQKVKLFSNERELNEKRNTNERELNEKRNTNEKENTNEKDEYIKKLNKAKYIHSNQKYIKIPNKEVLKCFIDLDKCYIKNKFKELVENEKVKALLNDFIYDLLVKDIEKGNKNLTEYLKIFNSHQLFTELKIYENVYQILVTQMCIISNKDFANDKNDNKNNKRKKIISNKQIENILQNECIDAINQIEEKDYAAKHRMEGYNTFIKYGIAFYKKYCKIAMKIDNGKIQHSSFKYNNINGNNNDNDNDNINNNNNSDNNNND